MAQGKISFKITGSPSLNKVLELNRTIYMYTSTHLKRLGSTNGSLKWKL